MKHRGEINSSLLNLGFLCICIGLSILSISSCKSKDKLNNLEKGFIDPPDSARSGVYWYFMDGNVTKEAMTKDLESMKRAGIGYLVYLEVNVGVPRGKVDFLSEEWKQLFKHAVEECERLGIAITLGIGPGWTGSGGPWVDAEASMQHLVYSTVEVYGNSNQTINLSVPLPKQPYFGEGGFTPEVKKQWDEFYKDVVVIAFPAPSNKEPIADIDEKALYYRAPYSSVEGVKQFLPSHAEYKNNPQASVNKNNIIDLSSKMNPDGTLTWDVPDGKWTIMRFGCRNNGAVTRPAPLPGVGLESDKFDTTAINAHLDKFTGELFRTIGKRDNMLSGGLKMLHMDSWEMGAQNWSARFREEFTRRRGYDPQPFYPVYAGVVVENTEMSERFLWDLRLTSQELVLEKHVAHVKLYAKRHGLGLSIEPYDMNPTSDLELGAMADVPMCEFWSIGGYNTSFSAIEGTSAAHVIGQTVVPSEAFTAAFDGWKQHPGSMKNQTDWAFANGINRLMYHTFQHQMLDDKYRPGMTMGPYGVHWDRNQTWWAMADGYHRYVSRCQYLLQQGRTVADILYLAPEGAPHVFRAPTSALEGNLAELPDRKGYNFDGCPPSVLYNATVKDGAIVLPSSAIYKILVLSCSETMTPLLLNKINNLVLDGATVVGLPPRKSPSLENYPICDQNIEEIAAKLWGGHNAPVNIETKKIGKGNIIWSSELQTKADNLYPQYDFTAYILDSMGIMSDFETSAPLRYTHRTMNGTEIYFVSNRSAQPVNAECFFRVKDKHPELWNPMTGEIRSLPNYQPQETRTSVSLEFAPHESFFVVFREKNDPPTTEANFSTKELLTTLRAPWSVAFDPAWGGPQQVTFNELTDWSKNDNLGIKYYSGIAEYSTKFDMPLLSKNRFYINLGKVKNMARVWLNGKDMGVVWTDPWQVDITEVVREKDNELKIEVVNLWPNRLIGDEQLPDDGIKGDKWPEWMLNDTPRSSGRYTFTTFKHYNKDSPLLESGLLGPVTILIDKLY